VAAVQKKGKKNEEIPTLGITDKYDAEWGKGLIKEKILCCWLLKT